MNSIATEQPKATKLPALFINSPKGQVPGLIVLFTGESTGMVMGYTPSAESPHAYHLGYHTNTWSSCHSGNWELYKGKIEISN